MAILGHFGAIFWPSIIFKTKVCFLKLIPIYKMSLKTPSYKRKSIIGVGESCGKFFGFMAIFGHNFKLWPTYGQYLHQNWYRPYFNGQKHVYKIWEKKWRWYIFEIVTIVKMAVMAKKMAKMQKMQKKLIFQLKKIYLR